MDNEETATIAYKRVLAACYSVLLSLAPKKPRETLLAAKGLEPCPTL